MKFLGLRLDEHDSNITYTDGFNVKYFKPERHNQIKHFGYNNTCINITDTLYYVTSVHRPLCAIPVISNITYQLTGMS